MGVLLVPAYGEEGVDARTVVRVRGETGFPESEYEKLERQR